MREISLNIQDVVHNSITAKATFICLKVAYEGGWLTVTITDNGCGMDNEFLSKVLDPFTTKRTTRKVGLGLPLFKMAAESAGGTLTITSELGVGTAVTAKFDTTNIDCMPLGNIKETIIQLIIADESVDYFFEYTAYGNTYVFDTREVKAVLSGIPLSSMEVLDYIDTVLEENISDIKNGTKE